MMKEELVINITNMGQELQEEFINELATKYIEKYPLDNNGLVHLQMVRLEVEALRG